MINIVGLVYGEAPVPSISPIHPFNEELDLYEYAEFSKPNGDFYQIVKVSEYLVLYHFQKSDAEITSEKLSGNWWLRHHELTRRYENRNNIFEEKVNDRIAHGYHIDKLVVRDSGGVSIPHDHDRFQEIQKAYSK